jgi:4-hydroxy-tetrahydrodipicolinate reductase
MIRVIVTGAGGRMGGRIISQIFSDPDMWVIGAVEQKGHAQIGRDIGDGLGLGKTGIIIEEELATDIETNDVVIDFTHHEASMRHLEVAAERRLAIVIGSTGFSDEEMKRIKKLAPKTRCVLAPNMSVGVNVMFKVLEYVAGILGDEYDIEILEAHHNMKKDAPSGTAMKMAGIIADKLNRNLEQTGVYTRKGMVGERTKTEIGIQTIRAGDIVGDHMVMFGGVGERLEFIHRAHNRDNFAKGAIKAAKWIVHQKNGLYDMQDVLGLKGN